MNYTKTIREYCLQNKGGVFDIHRELVDHFPACKPKTFYKILKRLEEEGVLVRKAHGVYLIVADPNDRTGSGDKLVDWYTNNGHGVVVGYDMYNKFKITPYHDGKIVIYTNRIRKGTQTVGKHHFIYLNIKNFDKRTCNVIYLLELIEHRASIIDLDFVQWDSVINSLLADFNAFFYDEVLMAKEYKYATICTLCDQIQYLGRESALFMDMYLFHWGEKGVKDEHRYIEVTPDIFKKG